MVLSQLIEKYGNKKRFSIYRSVSLWRFLSFHCLTKLIYDKQLWIKSDQMNSMIETLGSGTSGQKKSPRETNCVIWKTTVWESLF